MVSQISYSKEEAALWEVSVHLPVDFDRCPLLGEGLRSSCGQTLEREVEGLSNHSLRIVVSKMLESYRGFGIPVELRVLAYFRRIKAFHGGMEQMVDCISVS